MALDPKMKKALIIGGLAVAAYLIYRWYENRQAANNASGGLGTNLGSAAASTLTSLSAGPSTELNYYGQNPNTTTTQSSTPVTTSQSGSTSSDSNTSSNQTSDGTTPFDYTSFANASLVNTNAAAGNNYSGASPQNFLAAFQATGQNAGQIVPGGTGQPIPLLPGQSYTS